MTHFSRILTVLFLSFFVFRGFFVSANYVRAAQADHVVISEVQVAGEIATKDEWVELYNPTAQAVVLDGYSLKKKTKSGAESALVSSQAFSGTIPAHGFFLIANKTGYLGNVSCDITFSGSTYSIANDNAVILYDAGGQPTDKVGWGEAGDFEAGAAPNPDPGQSLQRQGGEDSDDNAADFFVQANPNPQNSGSADSGDFNDSAAPAASSSDATLPTYSQDIVISEVFPNPEGADTESEFIELKNEGRNEVNLQGWKLGDDSARTYAISGEGDFVGIQGGGYLAFYRKQTKIALNNGSGDSVKLYQPDDTLLDSVHYDDSAPEGQSYAKGKSGRFSWTQSISPGAANNWPPRAVIYAESQVSVGEKDVFDASDSFDPDGDSLKYSWDFSDAANPVEGMVVTRVFGQPGEYRATLAVSDGNGHEDRADLAVTVFDSAIPTATDADGASEAASEEIKGGAIANSEEIKASGLGEKVTARGIVSAEPGALGKQIFYVAGPDIQAYMFRADFPDLKVGDEVELSGVLSESGGESRLKLSSRDDIKVLGQNDPPLPEEIEIGEIGEDLEGHLVEICGEVTEIKGNNIFIDDGSAEAKIYIKDSAGIEKSEIKAGYVIAVAGIVSQTKDGYRLLPRSRDDIAVGTQGDSGEGNDGPKLGVFAEEAEFSSDDIFVPPPGQQKSGWVKYLLATTAFLAVVLAVLLVRKYGLPFLKKKRQPEDKDKNFTVTIE